MSNDDKQKDLKDMVLRIINEEGPGQKELKALADRVGPMHGAKLYERIRLFGDQIVDEGRWLNFDHEFRIKTAHMVPGPTPERFFPDVAIRPEDEHHEVIVDPTRARPLTPGKS